MKNTFLFLFLFTALLSYSCRRHTNYGAPVVKPEGILKSVMDFLIYRQSNIRLYEDFAGVGQDGSSITKETFLKFLSNGEFIPLRLTSKNDSTYYQLYPLDNSVNEDLRDIIKQWGQYEYTLYKMEGKALPEFNFVDINGKVYDKKTTSGKVMVLKCWFIACVPCVAEMPALNDLVNQYKNRNDILFVSLAFDSKENLKFFLMQHPFNYAVVPGQQNYIMEELKIGSFPTHLIINKQGMIAKVVNDNVSLAATLGKEMLK